MAYTRKWIKIGKRRIKIATGTRGETYDGDTQTINVCDPNNLDGGLWGKSIESLVQPPFSLLLI